MDEQNKYFRIFGFLDKLEKSIPASSSIDKEGVIIEGRFMNAVHDISGERPIIPEMIWDILKKSGNIKYEHDPLSVKKMSDGTLMAVAQANPGNIIGVPLNIKTSADGKQAFFKATLFPENDLVKSLIKKAKEFDEHNKRYPNNQRHFQLSVEGKYYKRDKLTKTYAGIAENIVISPQAQDESTYFHFVNAENLAMAKSLAAGTETNITNMKNGDSLRQESLEGNNKSNSRRKKMNKLGKNRDEVFSHFRKSCGTQKEAQEKTDEYMRELETERNNSGTSFAKSLNDGIDKIKKSITDFAGIETIIAAKQADVVKIDTEMKKSINTLREDPEKFSGEQFMQQQTAATVAFGTSLNEVQSQLVKSLATLAEGLADVLPLLKDIHSMTSDAVEQAADANEAVRYIARGLKKSQQGFTRSIDALEPMNGGEKPNAEKILKSINTKAVERYLVDKFVANQASPAIAQQYDEAYNQLNRMGRDAFGAMNKSIVSEIVQVFEAQFTDVQ